MRVSLQKKARFPENKGVSGLIKGLNCWCCVASILIFQTDVVIDSEGGLTVKRGIAYLLNRASSEASSLDGANALL